MARLISVLRFLLPFGRPLALPELPDLNRDDFGGFPYPTLYSVILLSVQVEPN
jgi:hypothetical protein